MQKFWLKEPAAHDFPAAADYLGLLFNESDVSNFVIELEKAKTITKKAKDVFRASTLKLLPKSNIHVSQCIKEVSKGKKLSPILLVKHEGKLIIADGYHRMCAIYYISEDDNIPCRLV
jgi:hypothetical protein